MRWQEFYESKKIEAAAKKSKLDISKFDSDQIKRGFSTEKEHDDGSDVDVVDNDTDVLKIAIAHLREDPKYYTKLKKIEGK